MKMQWKIMKLSKKVYSCILLDMAGKPTCGRKTNIPRRFQYDAQFAKGKPI